MDSELGSKTPALKRKQHPEQDSGNQILGKKGVGPAHTYPSGELGSSALDDATLSNKKTMTNPKNANPTAETTSTERLAGNTLN